MAGSGLGILEPTSYYGEVTGTVNMGLKSKGFSSPAHHTTEPESSVTEGGLSASNSREETNQTDRGDPEQGSEGDDTGLKKTQTGIVLFPQPHDDPNDPLNWPMWRRDLALAVIGFHSFICGGQTPLLAAAFSELSIEFNVSQSKLAYLVGPFMLAMGVGSVLLAPTAVLYGKRLVYLLAQVIFFAGAIWGACSSSFNSLLGARILMGIGASPTESLPSSSIAEIYFLHERAYRLGIYTLLLLGGKNIVPMVSAFIIGDIGWKWLFWILTIIIGLNFALTFFFVSETWWDRTAVPTDKRSLEETRRARQIRELSRNSSFQRDNVVDAAPSIASSSSPRDNVENNSTEKSYELPAETAAAAPVRPPNTRHITIDENPPQSVLLPPTEISESEEVSRENEKYLQAALRRTPPKSDPNNAKRSFVSSLQIYYGKFTDDTWWMIALRPFVLFAYPGILFSTLIYSLSVLWLIVISETISKILSKPPYNFPLTSVGLLYIATFIGGCLGSALAGKLSDSIVRAMARRNNGVYEPEFRLVMCIPVLISVTMGMMGFGWSTFDHDMWIVPAIFLGIIGFGCSLGSTTAITYAVDSYKMFAAESLVTLNLSKNVFGFAFSFFVPSFLENSGSKTLFVTFGGVEVFICLWGIPLYIYGKRIRHWTDKKQLLRRLYHESSKSHS